MTTCLCLHLCETDTLFLVDAGGQSAAYAFVYPNLMLNRYGPWLDLNLVEPTGPQTCTVRFEYCLQEGFSADEGYLQESLEASETVQQEDVKLCEAVQRGLKSPAYDTGRYSAAQTAQRHWQVCLQ